MKIVFLGTNGWYDTETGNTICTLIETKNEYIILDAGNGFYKIDKHIKNKKPIYLFLSHFHLDHIIGLHILNKFNFTQGINIYGPVGVKKYLKVFLKKPFTAEKKKLKTKIKIIELTKSTRLPFELEFRRLKHSTICYGFRFGIEEKIITYCSDTGLCDNIFKLAKNADLLITECSYKSGEVNKNWPHLNPQDAARVGNESSVKQVALIHFDASRYSSFAERDTAERTAKMIYKNIRAMRDNMEIVV